ncbi:unnamed protein product [Fusarium graminearum]|uniref:Chromosome 1, complete genome n=2 Tax=Gibberella zeae TaxID=5518 RepID=A0A098D9Q1_GIBZE|nr:unnamed protein product [Fusarium graminearum]CAF3561163.1 unnamed protein product [Fusarium graminearum]CAF3611694.1 unnamed protein product [Fusarium graminearum]CAG1960936.1 unnamed protein product [Fusarium graminearum]CAG1973184.1 unnamed protein product [Fusarium graminearum]
MRYIEEWNSLSSLTATAAGETRVWTVVHSSQISAALPVVCHQETSAASPADESRQGNLRIWHTWSVPVAHSKIIIGFVQLLTEH